jgi:D-alanine--poly(phosphoribitol) ligase subunit 1
MFSERILQRLVGTFADCRENNAFFIGGTYYSYQQFEILISSLQRVIRSISDDYIALVANDDLETYASIIALWLEGKCYVPLHPYQPEERCVDIIEQVGIRYVMDSSESSRYLMYHTIDTRHVKPSEKADIDIVPCSDAKLAYILFTSGSTGRPKGVRISRANLAAFVDAFEAMGYRLTKDDRCLQMFDLTFDLSVMSYLLPLLNGACAYTVAPTRIKYQAVFELLDEQALTFAMMVPSVIHYLRPYMDEIQAPTMRYSLFAGEALPLDDVEQWSQCVPQATIANTYGPTEATIICTGCEYRRSGGNKEVNGAMSIGRAMKGTECIIVDDENRIAGPNVKGELCLAGPQLTPGYWNNEQKNRESFFNFEGRRYYHSGDICSFDSEGDLMYYGRKDSQVKVQGFRIELSEIECVAKRFYDHNNAVVALPVYDDNRNCTIQIAVEKGDGTDNAELIDYLKRFLPSYMIPVKTHFLDHFPLNANNKIDRRRINNIINQQ